MSGYLHLSGGDGDGRDDRVTRLLRDLVAAPAEAEYWTALEARIMTRVTGAAPQLDWGQLFVSWARIGAAAAAIAVLAVGAVLVQTRASEARVAYEAVIDTPPATRTVLPSRGISGREATLFFVISH